MEFTALTNVPALITVWLEVISQRLAKGPQLAGFDVGVSVSAETFFGLEAIVG
jgi:hypothetical protein